MFTLIIVSFAALICFVTSHSRVGRSIAWELHKTPLRRKMGILRRLKKLGDTWWIIKYFTCIFAVMSVIIS